MRISRKVVKCTTAAIVVLLSLFFWLGCSRPGDYQERSSDHDSRVLMLMLTGESADDFAFILRALKSYQEKTGVSAKASAPYDSANSRLRLLQDLFARRSTEPDICAIDNVWPGLLADDLVDLKPYLGDEMTAIDRSLLEAFTVKGRLVALPEFLEAPVLYYRSDLLHKYGYKEPPETWDDLTRMATVIQDGERKAGAANFWGYVWEGAEGEALNCNALEWQQAEGANLIDNSGAVCPLNPSAESAVRRARSWVGTISPPSVYEYDEDDVYNVWLAGSAAFARGWLAAYESSKKSPYLAAGFGTAHMPAGSKGYAWTFGGMGLAVSKYSHNQQAAAQVVRYLTSSAIQRQRLIASSAIPTRTDLLSNTALLQETAFGGWLSVHWRQGMLYRPSAVMGEKYSSIARAYSKAIHNAISGKQDTHEALTNLHTELIGMTHK